LADAIQQFIVAFAARMEFHLAVFLGNVFKIDP
jgi:hypothetical protein